MTRSRWREKGVYQASQPCVQVVLLYLAPGAVPGCAGPVVYARPTSIRKREDEDRGL